MLSIGLVHRLSTDDGRRWLRRMIIGGVLLSSAYLAPRASDRLLVLVFGIGGVLILLRWPPLGLLALVAASLVVPFQVGTGTATSINATVLLLPALTGLCLVDMLARQELRLRSSRPVLPLLLLVLVATFSLANGNQTLMLFAQTAPFRAQIGGLAIFFLSASAFLLAGHMIRDTIWLQRLTWLFLALGGLYIAGRLAQELGRPITAVFPDGGTGSLFWVWLVALAFGQTAFNSSLRLPWRLMLGGLVIAVFYVGLVQSRGWASGWLPAAVALVVSLLVGKPRLGILALLAGGTIVVLDASTTVGTVMVEDNQYSLLTRVEAWGIVGEIVKSSPLLGLGPANYYWYTPLFSIMGYNVNFNSHNNYMDIVAQTGILGLVCFFWFFFELARLGWRLRTRVPAGFARAYVYGAMGGLAGTLVAAMLGDWVIPFVYNIGLQGFRATALGWLFLGGLIALEWIHRAERRIEAETDGSP